MSGKERLPAVPSLQSVLERVEGSRIWFHGVNVLIAAVLAHSAYRTIDDTFLSLFRPSVFQLSLNDAAASLGSFFLLLNQLLTVLFFLLRRRSSGISGDLGSVAAANLAVWLPFLFQAGEPRWAVVVRPCLLVIGAAALVSLLGIISMGRRWGILPANRGLQTHGLYRVVRHPVYAGYIAHYCAYSVYAPSVRNLAVCVAAVAVTVWRALCEETLLFKDPEYRAYAARTRARFVPGIY